MSVLTGQRVWRCCVFSFSDQCSVSDEQKKLPWTVSESVFVEAHLRNEYARNRTWKLKKGSARARAKYRPRLKRISLYYEAGVKRNFWLYASGAQTSWLVDHICLSETLREPQELIISIKIILNNWSVKFSFQWKFLRGPFQGALPATVWAPLLCAMYVHMHKVIFYISNTLKKLVIRA